MRLALLVGCGQLCLSFSQVVGFYDHHDHWKKSGDLSVFLHGDSHQRKLLPKTNFLFGCGLLCLLSNQIEGFFDQ